MHRELCPSKDPKISKFAIDSPPCASAFGRPRNNMYRRKSGHKQESEPSLLACASIHTSGEAATVRISDGTENPSLYGVSESLIVKSNLGSNTCGCQQIIRVLNIELRTMPYLLRSWSKALLASLAAHSKSIILSIRRTSISTTLSSTRGSSRHRQESLFPPNRRTSSRRLCVPDAAPRPDAAASVDSARKTNCNDIPRDAIARILPTPTAVSDDDAVAVAHECFSSQAEDADVVLWDPSPDQPRCDSGVPSAD
jgi:hypothetical protein